jgi:hypothetical protein
MWKLIIDNPFGAVREVIQDKDMAAGRGGVLDMPPIEDELAMNPAGSQSGRQSDGIIDALSIFTFAFESGVAGDSVMERLAERPGAEHETRKNTGERDKNALRHGVFV